MIETHLNKVWIYWKYSTCYVSFFNFLGLCQRENKKGHTYLNGKSIWFANILKNNDDLVIGQLRFVFRYVQKGEEFD